MRTSRWVRRVGGALLGLGCLAIIAIVVGLLVVRHAVNDGTIPVSADLLPPNAPRRVMAVWAHPDDEITAAGTLALLAKRGAQVELVYFTHGEAAHSTGYSATQLWRMRAREAEAAGRILGASSVVLLDDGDGKLSTFPGDKARAQLRALVDAFRPSVLISFDERVGFYGHPDHAQVGRWTAAVARQGAAEAGFPVERLYQATLPGPAIALARKYIAAFRNHYPTPPAASLPPPTVAVPIAAEASAKRAVLDAHVSQVKVIDDVQPLGRRLPAWLYYRLFDREYFALARP